MKKGCFFILLLLCVFTLTACAGGFDDTEYAIISEGNVSEDGFIYSVYENKTAAITGIKTPDTVVTVPEKVGGYTVVEIASEAFRDDEMLQLLTLPKTVTKVSESAFSGCSALIKADLGGGVKKIEASAFYDCEYLCEVVGTDSLIYIDEVAFYACTSLARFSFPESLKTIGNEAFGTCIALTEVALPEKIESIGNAAFSYCSALTRLDLGGLEKIPDKAFLRCTSLGRVILKDRVTEVGAQAFRGCDRLFDLYVSKSVKMIGSAAFSSCPEMKIRYEGSETAWDSIERSKDDLELAVHYVQFKQKLDKE